MKSYSFVRETAPVVMRNPPKDGTVPANLYCKNVKCVHATGGVIPLSDIWAAFEKLTEREPSGWAEQWFMLHLQLTIKTPTYNK